MVNNTWDTPDALATDEERYHSTKRRWQSTLIPDPFINLTTQTMRLETLQEWNLDGTDDLLFGASRKRPADEHDSVLQGQAKRIKLEISRTETLKSQCDRLEEEFTNLKNEITEVYDVNRARLLRIIGALEEEDDNNEDDDDNENIVRYEKRYKLACDNLASLDESHKNNLEFLDREFERAADKLRSARERVFTFQAFYAKLRNSENVDAKQINIKAEMEDYDRMEQLYIKFYGRGGDDQEEDNENEEST